MCHWSVIGCERALRDAPSEGLPTAKSNVPGVDEDGRLSRRIKSNGRPTVEWETMGTIYKALTISRSHA